MKSRGVCGIWWDLSFLVQWAKKALGMLFYATYLISLIPSVRATDKCRFDTRIWVFLDPLPENMVLLLLQILFEVWDIWGTEVSFTFSGLWTGFGPNHTNTLWRIVHCLQSRACIIEMRIISFLPAASYLWERERSLLTASTTFAYSLI